MIKPLRERSPLVYVLIGLIPYSRPNLLLAFKPNQFFRELEKVSRYKKSTLQAAYRRAQQQELIRKQEDLVALTAKGRQKLAPFIAEELDGAKLMVIFDIPENIRFKRRQFRQILQHWQFSKVQQSVWLTTKDYRQELKELIDELNLSEYVEVYECIRHLPV